ncbi:MAG TPA: hypothetical protein VMT28_02560 [Terriglobales bacterium]|jgi:hypothetical protein|nr:hypothetical protein [Terriglobales bacterium]
MPEEQILSMLREIRDLQKQHLENYKLALQNQERALQVQQQAVRRSRVTLLVIGLIVVAIYLLPAFWWTTSWAFRCLLRR